MDIREPECPVLPLKTQTYLDAKCPVSPSESLTRLKVAVPGTYSQATNLTSFYCGLYLPLSSYSPKLGPKHELLFSLLEENKWPVNFFKASVL